MLILLIEDDPIKRGHVEKHILGVASASAINLVVEMRSSYHSGLRGCIDLRPSLVVLDMTLPTYDTASRESGRPRHFGGRDILRELRRRKMQFPTVVLTGFGILGEGSEKCTPSELDSELKESFPNIFLGTVFYSASDSAWRNELTQIILKLEGSTDR